MVVWLGRLAMPTTQPSRDSVPYCRVGTTRSGRSNVPVMISIRGPPMRRKLRGVPQSEQKSRSAMDEDWKAAGLPRVQLKSSCSMSAKEAKGAPEAFWHIRQWQMLILAGAFDTAKRMAPHWQPPVRTVLWLFSVMLTPSAARLPAASPTHRHRQRGNHRRRPRAARPPVRRAALPDRYAWRRPLEGLLQRLPRVPHRPCRMSIDMRSQHPMP